jgi:poly(3-hydroxybutyrate) depolymerase
MKKSSRTIRIARTTVGLLLATGILAAHTQCPAQVTGLVEGEIQIPDGPTRRYDLYVPSSYDGSHTWPLVISYHGFTMLRSEQQSVDRLGFVADSFLVAYPQGLITPNPFSNITGLSWNIDGNREYHDDFDFTQRIIEDISASYSDDLPTASPRIISRSLGDREPVEVAWL